MNRKKRIYSILYECFKGWNIEVTDNSNEHVGHHNFDGSQESHFKIILTNKLKDNSNRLELHRKINNLLKKEFSSGLHALEIKII